ncbi:MAG: 50S ribosomal protein L22 [Microthrixaceae bacterium]
MASITFDERKTNERPGVRAVHRHAGFSAYKAREVLDLIRGKSVSEARTILEFCNREAAEVIIKVLDSAVANAGNNNDIPPEELFVSACFADEGPTMKRWRPRARGRATRIRKRTCHITVIVGRFSQTELDRIRERLASKGRTTTDASASRARRVARSRSGAAEASTDEHVDAEATEAEAAEAAADEAATETVIGDEFAETASAEDDSTDEAAAGDTDVEATEAVADDSADAGDEPEAAADETEKKDD